MSGCKYCKNMMHEDARWQESRYGVIYMSHIGNIPTILIRPTICPPYADCSKRDATIGIAYAINYCPNCGRELWKEETSA